MLNKLFLYDPQKRKEYYYRDIDTDLKKVKRFNIFIYTDDIYEIFKNIILSIFYDVRITVLDSDFSADEIKKLGIKKQNLTYVYKISTNNYSINDLNIVISKLKKWRLTLFTSGTTGLPKKVTHSIETLTRMVKIDSNKSENVWGFAYNPTHIAGLQVFFQALLNYNSIINIFSLTRTHIYELINNYNVTNISATPSFYRLLLPFEKEIHTVKRITSGGEKYDEKLESILKQIFPGAGFLNIYASTEVGTLFSAKNDIFEIKKEVSELIKIIDSKLHIHKNLLAELDDFPFDGDWYDTKDLVQVISDDPIKFKFMNRINEMINIGGNKVNPIEIEEYVNSYDGVVASRVYSKKNSVLGNILLAEIKVEKKITEKELKQYLNKKLQSFKVPRIIRIVDCIETTRTGKIKRI